MDNPFSLQGKTILVTGATSGIGRQCAIDCSKMGAKVISVGRNEERLNSLREEIGANNPCYSYDLCCLDGIKDLVNRIVKEHRKIDGFIHAAGIEITTPLKLSSPKDFESLYKTNCESAFEICKQFCDIRVFNRRGSIVLLSSISGIIARKGLTAYAASKGALVSAAKVMALEMSNREIRVNTISPGTILTPMMQKAMDALSEEDKKKRVEGFPLGLGKTTDISNACIYLLSDASRWVTGQNLIIDGGYTAR